MATLDRRTLLGSAAALAAARLGLAAEKSDKRAAGPLELTVAKEPLKQDESTIGKTKTKFAINVEMWGGKTPFLDRIKMVARFGFPAFEFWPWRGKDLDAIERLTKDLGLEVAQFTAWPFEPGMNNPANHDKIVEEITEACKVAKKLGAKKMCVVGGNDQPGMTQAEMHKNITTALKRLAPIAEKNEVMLILEPMNIRVDHKGHCLYGSPAAVNICREVNSPMVKILWDLYHMHISEGDLCGHLREGFDQLGYAQFADHPGRNDPGTGEVCYNRVFKELYTLGYRGYVGTEFRPIKDDLTAARATAAADAW